ncbi:hypothetical protein ACLVWU_07780 [Bdellovibrio sp. HCB290]|uniref:hypothetical protein n=1 Tax=Bdellovibrio sp. HCB290 TaxID=3394356 RepID=UPI0039B4D7AF
MNFKILIAASLLVPNGVWAQNKKTSTTSVLPFTGPNMNDVVLDSQLVVNGSNSDVTTLDMYVSCFGTNLRSVPNPISEQSQITATLYYLTAAGGKRKLDITFPATATMKTYASTDVDLTNSTVLDNNTSTRLRARLKGNLIRINLEGAKTIPVDVLATGTDFSKLEALDVKSDFLSGITFVQNVPDSTTPRQFMAFDGPITAASNWYASENGKSLTMLAAFPSENRFCGGFFSPLVLKFDDELPKVEKTSKFPLLPDQNGMKISWPSFDTEMYFLTLDQNKNGKVDGGHELFGDINNFQDGFKNLEIYDSNKDGVIDSKDPVFDKLRLWKDRNHDGKSTASEVKTLKQLGVESISVKYTDATQDLGPNARLVGPGEFTYKDKKGVQKKGRVWDIFLKIVP